MYHRLDKELSVAPLYGIFRRKISLFQAIAVIVCGTVGAGVLGIPYAIAQSGVIIGMVYIIVLGFLMMGLNLLIGELASYTRKDLQLVGLARQYLGVWGGRLMTLITYALLFGVLVVYIIGEGDILSHLFGGSSFAWSVVFFFVGSILILAGMRTIRVVDFFLSIGILAVIIIIAWSTMPHLEVSYLTYTNFAYALFPYGVILFAYHGLTAIPEAHTLLRNRDKDFKEAISIAGILVMIAYALFALTVVGVTGLATTEIATLGLGDAIGGSMVLLGNLFALFAMGTGFIMAGLSLKDSLSWDYKISPIVSGLIVCLVPFVVFAFGVRSFILAIDVVGGVLVSGEMLMSIAIYMRARHAPGASKRAFRVRHSLLLITFLLLALSIGVVYSMFKLLYL